MKNNTYFMDKMYNSEICCTARHMYYTKIFTFNMHNAAGCYS